MCGRLTKVECRLAFLEGVESQEGKLEKKDAKIAKLEDIITELKAKIYTDEKTCNKIDGHLKLNANQVCRNRRHSECENDDDDTI